MRLSYSLASRALSAYQTRVEGRGRSVNNTNRKMFQCSCGGFCGLLLTPFGDYTSSAVSKAHLEGISDPCDGKCHWDAHVYVSFRDKNLGWFDTLKVVLMLLRGKLVDDVNTILGYDEVVALRASLGEGLKEIGVAIPTTISDPYVPGRLKASYFTLRADVKGSFGWTALVVDGDWGAVGVTELMFTGALIPRTWRERLVAAYRYIKYGPGSDAGSIALSPGSLATLCTWLDSWLVDPEMLKYVEERRQAVAAYTGKISWWDG